MHRRTIWARIIGVIFLRLLYQCSTRNIAIRSQNGIKADISREHIVKQLGDKIHALELVHVHPMTHSDAKKARILCWVNTYHKNHDSRIDAIKRTWGKKCDKILFMSDQEDIVYKTVRVHAPPFHKMSWQKHREAVRAILREIDERDFDWIYKCDDDTFVILENLRRLLLSPRIKAITSTTPLLLGHRMTLQWYCRVLLCFYDPLIVGFDRWELHRPFIPFAAQKREHVELIMKVDKATRSRGGLYYTPGGGGYVMNWAYLKLLASSLDEPHCLPHEIVPDDWATSFCMLLHNVSPSDTRDELGRERFHQYDPEMLYFAPHDEKAFDHSIRSSIYEEANWFSDHYGIGWKNGSDCCAADSISFHYIIPPFMDIIYEYYYNT